MGEILDAAVAIYRAQFGALVRIIAIVVVPVQILNVLVSLSSLPSTSSASSVFDARGTIWVPLAGNLVTNIIVLLSTAFATAAVTSLVADVYVSANQMTARRSLGVAWHRLGPVLGLALLVSLLVLAGSAMCLVPGIWLQVSLAVAMPAMILEQTKVSPAISRSFALVKGRWWACAGVHYLGSLLTVVVSLSLTGALAYAVHAAHVHGDLANAIVGGVTGLVASLLTVPFLACAVVVLYFDLRIRKEGFDVQMALHHLDSARA